MDERNTNNLDAKELEAEVDFRNQLLTVMNQTKNPMHMMLIPFLKRMGYYDKIIAYLPKLYVYCMRSPEGIAILEGLGVYGIITDFTEKGK